MNATAPSPLSAPFVCYSCGIAAAYVLFRAMPVREPVPEALFLLLCIGLFLACRAHFRIRYHIRFRFGALLPPLFFAMGVLAALLCCRTEGDRRGQTLGTEPAVWRAMVCGTPSVRERNVRLTVRLRARYADGTMCPVDERCRLTLVRDSRSELLAYGDVLFFNARLHPVPSPLNEGEFAYNDWLSRKGVYRQAYLQSGSWMKAERREGVWLLRQAGEWHRRLFLRLKGSGMGDEAVGFVSAMLLGDDALLDPAVSESYSAAGVSHILCVSGMHVGMLCMMTEFLFFFLNRSRRLRMIKMLLHLLVVWSYACLVSLTPSVVRSAVMFSFVAVGGLFRRRTPVTNSLLTAAFLMLLLRPMLLFETGFQLSFLAVWGIVRTQPLLNRLWNPSGRVAKYLWGVCSVSVSAQLYTAPVSVLCFHRFPAYFLLSNLMVVFFAPVVIGTAVFHLLFSFSSPLAGCSGWLLENLVRLMHAGVSFVGGLPGAVIGGIPLDVVQTVLLYLLLLTIPVASGGYGARRILLQLSLLLIFLGDGVRREWVLRQRREIVVYSLPHHYAVECGAPGASLLFTDAADEFRNGRFKYNMEGCRIRHGWTETGCVGCDTVAAGWMRCGGFFQIGKSSFLSPSGRILAGSVDGGPPLPFPDYLLVGDSLHVSPDRLLSLLSPGCVCLLPGLPSGKVARWRAACGERCLPCVELGRDGMIKILMLNL